MTTFVGEHVVMWPHDPLGKGGMTLDQCFKIQLELDRSQSISFLRKISQPSSLGYLEPSFTKCNCLKIPKTD